jgi:predicted enzyme related to lactoylglutathione lyase
VGLFKISPPGRGFNLVSDGEVLAECAFMGADNQIDYIEFQAKDLAATRSFFEQLFGWKFTDYGPDYTSFADGRIAGGFTRADRHSTIESGGVLVVFYHPRLEGVRQRVIELGGKITADIFSFPGGRRFHFTEPSGNECAIWSEDKGGS